MTICLSKVWMLLVTQAAVAFLLLLSSFFFFFSLSSSSSFLPSVSLLFLGCVCWFTTSLPGVVSQCRGACVAGHVPSSSSSSFFFLLSSSFSPCLLRRPFFLLSPSSSWGACAGLPRPYLGWCPSVGVRVLLATSLSPSASSSSSFSSSLSCLLLSPSSSWGARAGLPRPDLGWCHSVGVHVLLATSLLLLFLLLLFRPVFFVVLSSFCLPPLLGVCVLVYHVLTWGGVPVSGCVCCWPRPFLFCFFCFFFFLFFFVLSLSVSLLFLGCVCWFTTS